MLKLLCLLAIIHNVQNVRTCKWVCIDKNNNIKKEFINGKKISLDPQNKHEISVSGEIGKYKKKDVTFRNPEIAVEPIEDMCKTNESYKTIKQMAKKIKCRPRETIVNINYKGRKVIPSKITTKLCSGFCSGTKSCMSMETKNVSLSISIPDSSNRLQCSIVSIPQDVKCKCACDKKKLGCSPKQALDKKFCKCKCVNENDYRLCMDKIKNGLNKYHWNKDECLCKCKNEFVCSTGSKWDHNLCKCIRQDKE